MRMKLITSDCLNLSENIYIKSDCEKTFGRCRSRTRSSRNCRFLLNDRMGPDLQSMDSRSESGTSEIYNSVAGSSLGVGSSADVSEMAKM